MASQLERLASLETSTKLILWAGGIAITILTGWIAWATVSLVAIQQSIADGGTTKLVSELKAPKSEEQLKANLTTVSAQIQTAQVQKKRPDPSKVDALSGAVAKVILSDPQIPEAWQTASLLISYRTPPPVAAPPPCTPNGNVISLLPEVSPNLPSGRNALLFVGFILSNCTLALDGPSPIFSDQAFQFALNPAHKGIIATLILRNVHVIYKGGPLPNVRAIVFKNCTFEFQTNKRAPGAAPSLMEAILSTPIKSPIKFLNLPHTG